MPKQDNPPKRGFQPRGKRRVGGKGGGSNGSNGGSDDDVDSKGNVKGLIDYDNTSDDTSDCTDTTPPSAVSGKSSNKSPIAKRTRSQSQDIREAPKKKKLRRVVEDESDMDTDDSIGTFERRLEKVQNDITRLKKKLKVKGLSREEKQTLRNRIEARELEEATIEYEMNEFRRKARHRGRRRDVEQSSDDDDSDYYESDEDADDEGLTSDEEDSEEEDDEDDEENDDGTVEDEDAEEGQRGGIVLSFGIDENADRNVPKRHNMKKESAEVRRFVKLVTTPSDEDTIDGQIDQFKALTEEQRTKLLSVLEARNKSPAQGGQQGLMFKILTMNLPMETQQMVLAKYNSLQNVDPGSSEYYKTRNWLEKLTSMPLGIYKELPVKLTDGHETCGTFMERARKCLDDAIYGQDESKLQILQFIANKIANPDGHGMSLLLAGPPGIGKTSLIKNGVAKALQWPFQFISLGGDSDASTYTGHQLVYEGSHCGKIVNSIVAAKSMSMVLMFDEVDKISTTPKGEEVQNLLVHLTDPVQNGEFEDKYLSGIPIDLSRVMFTFSANYLERIDKVLLDRMVVINLQGYNTKEKVAIAELHLLPAALKEVGLTEKVGISKDVLQHILEEYANEETGVRELKRCIEQVAQKINMLRMFNDKSLPFYIKDFSLPFVVKKDHIDLFLRKKEKNTNGALHMYS
jgi:hypothetical protein